MNPKKPKEFGVFDFRKLSRISAFILGVTIFFSTIFIEELFFDLFRAVVKKPSELHREVAREFEQYFEICYVCSPTLNYIVISIETPTLIRVNESISTSFQYNAWHAISSTPREKIWYPLKVSLSGANFIVKPEELRHVKEGTQLPITFVWSVKPVSTGNYVLIFDFISVIQNVPRPEPVVVTTLPRRINPEGGGVLRDLMEGTQPERVAVEGNLPFNLQKQEKLIWVFQDVDYFEEKKRREYVGGSTGVSVRVAKGLYLRTSAFKGRPVDTLETVHLATGLMAVTNKHLYFAGGNKSFGIRHDKIVSFEPFSDGVGVQRDAQTARPQTFVTGDGWFTYNLLRNVGNL